MTRERVDFYNPQGPKGFLCVDLECDIPQLYYVILQTRIHHPRVRSNIIFDGFTVN